MDIDLMTVERPPNTQRLIEIGEALYGERWQRALAEDLGIDKRQIHRWVSGQYVPDAETMARLEAIALQRIADIEQALGKRRRKTTTQ